MLQLNLQPPALPNLPDSLLGREDAQAGTVTPVMVPTSPSPYSLPLGSTVFLLLLASFWIFRHVKMLGFWHHCPSQVRPDIADNAGHS